MTGISGKAPYRIELDGLLGPELRAVFADVEVLDGPGITVLTAQLDQAGLFGLLHRVAQHSLLLLLVERADGIGGGPVQPAEPVAPGTSASH